MALIIATVLFGIFAADVLAGALAGVSILGDTQEMLVLFLAAIAFVTVILKREKQSKNE